MLTKRSFHFTPKKGVVSNCSIIWISKALFPDSLFSSSVVGIPYPQKSGDRSLVLVKSPVFVVWKPSESATRFLSDQIRSDQNFPVCEPG